MPDQTRHLSMLRSYTAADALTIGNAAARQRFASFDAEDHITDQSKHPAMHKTSSIDVMEATAGRQEPYTYGSLPGREDFFFVGK